MPAFVKAGASNRKWPGCGVDYRTGAAAEPIAAATQGQLHQSIGSASGLGTIGVDRSTLTASFYHFVRVGHRHDERPICGIRIGSGRGVVQSSGYAAANSLLSHPVGGVATRADRPRRQDGVPMTTRSRRCRPRAGERRVQGARRDDRARYRVDHAATLP